MRIRFRLVSDAAGTADGWTLDEIRILVDSIGDVNADGSVNVLDAVRVINIILGIGGPATDYEEWAADCNTDGMVS
ncbi:MAG: dockerin type I domain-containing protein [bacterium]